MSGLKEDNSKEIVGDYTSGVSIENICSKYHIGKLRVKDILNSNNVIIRKKNCPRIRRNFVVNDWRILKYPIIEGFHYIAVTKDGNFETADYQNQGGILTSYISKTYGVEVPSLYDRRIFYQTTGDYWWEQWFNIVKIPNEVVKKCPYCEWETKDVDNKSGAFELHLKVAHNKTVADHIKDYPEDITYFKKYQQKIEHEKMLENSDNFVLCPICGKKFEKLTKSHVLTHGLDFEDFKKRYPEIDLVSKNMYQQAIDAQSLANLSVSKSRFISNYEKEIKQYLTDNNISYLSNRQILIGKEIDILIEDKKIGIEFDGLKWHTEWFGKKAHNYHLQKTLDCNKKGYGLVHIFEDEYVSHKDIVYKKLSHILKLDNDLPKIMGRKCAVKEIYKSEAESFLNTYHIQGYTRSTVYLGCFYENKLIAVMSFKNGNIKNPCWELTRFASDYNYRCQGVGGKMFKYFIKKYTPSKIISFADRRWTLDINSNLYTNLGFVIDKICPPDYRYYKDDSKDGLKYKRIHKMLLNKKTLAKKYGFPLTMTETEMAKELGYDRIWDCGLIKYVWTPESAV